MGTASGYTLASLLGTDFVLGPNSAGIVKRYAGTEFGKLNVEGQLLVGGAGVTPKLLSIPASPDAPLVIDTTARPLQYINNIAPFAIGAPIADGSCTLMIFNSQSPDGAGAVTFSNFTMGTSTGDAIATTAGAKYSVSIWRINGVSGYNVVAHQ